MLKYNLLEIQRTNVCYYKVYFENGVLMGDILCKEDGFYDWWPIHRNGCLSAAFLRNMADLLDEMNAPWQRDIDAYFDNAKFKDVNVVSS